MIVLVPILLCSAFLLAYEFWALATGRELVTTFIRDAFAAAPGAFLVVILNVGILIGHFFWNQ